MHVMCLLKENFSGEAITNIVGFESCTVSYGDFVFELYQFGVDGTICDGKVDVRVLDKDMCNKVELKRLDSIHQVIDFIKIYKRNREMG